jgi:hypothetical protein
MSVIHLSGDAWINCFYAMVSESCESMVGYTADLGKCLCDAEALTCYAHVCIHHVVMMPLIGR